MNRVGSIRQEDTVQFTIYWNIRNYSNNLKCLRSPSFFLWGAKWALQLHPNRNTNVKFMTIYLIREKSSIESHQIELKLGMESKVGLILYEKSRTSFTDKVYFWEAQKFCERTQHFDIELKSGEELTCFCKMHLLDNFTANISVQTETITDHIKDEKINKAVCTTEDLDYIKDEKIDKAVCTTEGLDYIKDEKIDKAICTTEGLGILSKDIERLLQNEEECDVTLTLKDGKFKAHRLILGTRSPVFASMFKHNMSEKNTGVINIIDCESNAFKQFLYYVYAGKVENLSMDIAADLYGVAAKYMLDDLKNICIQFMRQEISVDSACDIIALAIKYNETDLIKHATEFFVENARAILVTVKWQTFMTENPIEANELFLKILNK